MCAHEDSNEARATGESPFFGDVCLLGLGVTGLAVVDFFCNNQTYLSSLSIYSSDIQPDRLAYLQTLPEFVSVHVGDEPVSGTFDLAVVSPGIPPSSDLYLSAQKAATEVISEPELAWRIAPERWIAITGTNGKTTVTELIATLLQISGRVAWATGNIGTPCIEIIEKREPTDWLVAELSSYQLHSTVRFAPDVAVLLNITPDHLSWHGTHENYVKAKEHILANVAADAPVVLDVCLPETRAIADELARQGRRVIRVGSEEGLVMSRVAKSADTDDEENAQPRQETAFVDSDTGELTLELAQGTYTLLHADELSLKGPHNCSNALAAAAVAAGLGVDPEEINAVLAYFAPLPHRFEPCGEVSGVTFINDSKATNTDAAIKALSSFEDETRSGTVVAMLGGHDKGTDLADLVRACKVACRSVVCYGEAGKRFFAVMRTEVHAVLEQHFDEAFEHAYELAQSGDTVLLSPACASFDEFDSFEARGRRFKENVAQLQASHHVKANGDAS